MAKLTAEKVSIPEPNDVWKLLADLERLVNSQRTVVPAADQTAAEAIASAMVTAGRAPSDTNPLVVWNIADARLQVKNSAGWRQVTGPRFWEFTRTQATDSGFTTAMTGLVSGTISAAPVGYYEIVGQASLYASGGATGYMFVQAASTVRKRRHDLVPNSSPTSPIARMTYFHAGGDLTITAGYDRASGTATVTAQASGLTDVTALRVGG